ncbi:MAG TPA: TonB-dependent receptor, partial [Flavobacteriales bacterium]|nr:TonB-dependent receptor [Flavobacteriales bacterium]
MKAIFLGLIFLFGIEVTMAQRSVGGVVRTENGDPLPNATVRVIGTLKGTVSDADGKFELKNITASPLIIEITYIGYKVFRDTLSVSADPAALEISLSEESFLADALVVTATRVEPSAPVAHTTLTNEKIQEMNTGKDVPYIVSQTPSVVSSSDAGAGIGYTALRIRGIDQTSINVTINGIALNDPEGQGVYWVDIPDFSSSLSDIQIQRGVGSSTNGPASFGASINMQTEPVNQKAYVEVGGSYGSFNSQRTVLKLGSGIFAKYWAVDGRLSTIRSDGYIDRASTDMLSYYFSLGFNNGKTSVKLLSFGGREETYQAWYGVDEFTLKTDRTFNIAGAKYDSQDNIYDFHENEIDHYEQDHLQLHMDHKISALWRIQTSVHFTYGRGYFEQYKQEDSLHYYNLSSVEI